MKHFSALMLAGASAAAIIGLAGCEATDVVAKVAKTSFGSMVTDLPTGPSWDEKRYSWTVTAPGGDRLYLSGDIARNPAGNSASGTPNHDARFAFDAAPFLAAGLDLSRLPPSEGIAYELEDGEFRIGFELGSNAYSAEARRSVAAAFAELVKFQRSRIGYHAKLDHYGIKLGNGNMFEWARDAASNDKDIVFILNPEPFIAAGVDPSKLEGWIYAPVEMMDEKGKAMTVDKLLRPFDLP